MTAMVFAWYQRRMVDEARRWGRHLLEAQDAERQRIARELHDDMVPRLYATRLTAERMAVSGVPEQLGEVMRDLRTLAHDLHPPALKHLDLAQALGELAGRHNRPDAVAVTVQCADGVAIVPDAAVVFYRIAQESLQNALRHGEASTIAITVVVAAGQAELTVADDGCGFTPGEVGPSFGLRSMRERVEAIGGSLELQSSPRHGTRVIARVPR